MKTTFIVITIIVLSTSATRAQRHEIKLSAGPEISIPTYSGISSGGIGGGISLDYFLTGKIALTGSISVNYFKGNVLNPFKNDTVSGFSLAPILVGGKYFFTEKFYAGGSAGLVVGLHHAANHLALSPGAGMIIPVSSTSGIDLGVRLTGVPRGYSFSENSFINKGGYSFLTFRVAYVF